VSRQLETTTQQAFETEAKHSSVKQNKIFQLN